MLSRNLLPLLVLLTACGGASAPLPSIDEPAPHPGPNGGSTVCRPAGAAPVNLVQGEAPADARGSLVNLTSDGRYVYFNGDALYRVSLLGGAVETVYDGPFSGGFASGGGTLVYATSQKFGDGSSWVWQDTSLVVTDPDGRQQTVGFDGGEVLVGPLLTTSTGDVLFATGPSDLSSSHAQVWSAKTHAKTALTGVPLTDWYDRGDVFYWGTNDAGKTALFAVDAAGATKPRKLVDGDPQVIGFDATNVYVNESLCPAGNLDGACAFRVHAVPRDGTTPESIAFESVQAYSAPWMFADDSGVYWADWQNRDGTAPIFHAKLAPGAATTKVADTHATTYAVDACNVYWLDDPAHVMAVAK